MTEQEQDLDYESFEWWAPSLHEMPDDRLETICGMLVNGDLDEWFSDAPPSNKIRSRFDSFSLDPIVQFGCHEITGLVCISLLWDKRSQQACLAIGDPIDHTYSFVRLPDRRPSTIWPHVEELLLDGVIFDYDLVTDQGELILERNTSPLESLALTPDFLEFYGNEALGSRLSTLIKKLYKAHPPTGDVKESWPTAEAWLKAVL
jgi:hypothetical protein